MFSLVRVVVALVACAVLSTCVPPAQETVPATDQETLSVDDLLAKLDGLQESASRNLTTTGRSAFRTQAGQQISLTDLAAYLNQIKQGFGSYLKSRGAPYLVQPVPISSYPSKAANDITGINLSGLMWVPFTWGRHLNAPIISLQHGTQVYRPCAPSQFNLNPLAIFSNKDQSGALQNYVECIVGGLMASAGYIVLMPDYPGFGSNGDAHPFVHMSLGNSVRDLVAEAKKRLTGAVVPKGAVFLTGYSEGGYATMAGAQALQKAITGDSSFGWAKISAVVPCDGPYDLSGVMLGQMTKDEEVKVPWYLLYTAFGYKSVYDDIPLDQLLSENALKLLTEQTIFDGKHTNADIGLLVPADTHPLALLGPGALATNGSPPGLLDPGGKVYGYLSDNNSYAGWSLASPPVFIHCPADDVVPVQNAVVAAAALGATVIPVPPVPFVDQVLGSVHTAAYPTAILAAFTWIENNRGN
jgi:hypothetical protein